MTTLLDYLAHAAAHHPHQVAVADSSGEISYAELATRSTTLAAALCRAGAGPGQRVVFHLPPGHKAVIAIWAILKTGAAYVPIDPACPPARLATLLTRIQPQVVITPFPVTCTASSVDIQAAYGDPEPFPAIRPHPDDPAYILHTSGSTGVPKGVVLTHTNATAFVNWAVQEFDLGPTDRIAGHAPTHFDLSILDIFGAAKAAATLLPVPASARIFGAQLAAFLRHSRTTVLYCVPTALTMLSTAATSHDLTQLRCVLFAGEVCPPSTLRTMAALAPHAQYANLYGPTETNVCTYYRLTPADLHRATLPIGYPLPGVSARVMATPDREAEPEEPGELYVTGPTVAAGYWNDPQQTATRFLTTPAGRTYRTGDVVTRAHDGLLYFHGRLDRQIKTRGHRVELDEVEAALRAHPQVNDAVVFAVADPAITNRLIAAVVTTGDITTGQLRKACADFLPAYAIPTAVYLLEQLPLTSTGKLDRAAVSALLTTPNSALVRS